MQPPLHRHTQQKHTIGIPRGLLYYRYGDLWRDFLESCGHTVVVSPNTDQKLLSKGSQYAIDEACLPFKVYLGHVDALRDACDAVLVPHVETMGHNAEACLRFQGLYDLVQNMFRSLPLVPFELNSRRLPATAMAFLRLGHELGHSPYRSLSAYRDAHTRHRLRQKKLAAQQNTRLQSRQEGRLKILLLAQSYVMHDALLSNTVTRTLKQLDADLIFSDHFDAPTCVRMSRQFSKDLYWVASQEMVGAFALFRHLVNGIITVTAFPCGADAMVNELLLRHKSNSGETATLSTAPPLLHLVIDDLDGEAGIETRLESFCDMIRSRKRVIEKQPAILGLC